MALDRFAQVPAVAFPSIESDNQDNSFSERNLHEAALPEGAAVSVTYPALLKAKSAAAKRRIQVPLVRSGEPGSVHLTGARIAEILDAEDASSRR
jgi:hypothetical protein